MYCSNSVSTHLLRGVAALGLIIGAIWVSSYGLMWSGLPALAAIVLLRGCPMCWLMGLFETIAQRQNRSL